MIRLTFLIFVPVILATYPDKMSSSNSRSASSGCRSCDAHGLSRRPDTSFTHRDGCREYNCWCDCDGSWDCPADQITDVCKSDDECQTCWAGNAVRETNRPFEFTEDCYKYSCFCACDGSWDCPKQKTVDICNTDPETGCYYCNVGDMKHKGNTHFKHVNGCIEYDHCTCNCDGSWNCPGEHAQDKCRTNPDTGCYYCEANGNRYEDNTYFKYTNGCIEYNCACNCDGSWNCPGERARDLCRQNITTGCYYCDVDDYLYQGRSEFDLVRDCYKYPGCTCACDGGWTCAHTTGEYICDSQGREQTDCNTCNFDGKKYRGNSMFSLEKECVKYICTCDCAGRLYCPSANARKTCENGNNAYFASISRGASLEHAHTRAPRQVSVDNECVPCYVSEKEVYYSGDQFSREAKCNKFYCYCKCDGSYECPSEYTQDICRGSGSSRGSSSSSSSWESSSSSSSGRGSVSGGGAVSGGGLDATSGGTRRQGSSVTAIGRGTLVPTAGGAAGRDRDTGVNVCINCEYLGVTYEENRPFTFEKGCFQYNCYCACNGSFDCPSERSEYICEGRKECVRCDLTDYDGSFKEPNTNFQIRRGCDLFERCRCNCDGGWSCDDGVYTCELKSGCEADGRRFAEGAEFELTRGCDLYKDCFCHENGEWNCEGRVVEDLCGQCRKCKIGDNYYDGDTTFGASVNCTRYSRCSCNCDGTYECRGGRFTCDSRGDQPPEGQCTDCIIDGRRYRQGQSFDYTASSRGCLRYKSCECKCGETTCREVDDTCGDCRSCNVDGVDYAGGSQFTHKQGCFDYSRCECNCNGRWECFGDSAKDTCNTCRKCNVDGTVYEPYSKFKLDRKCWNYQCFCLCNGTTVCPSATVVNTCNRPDRCQNCEVEGRNIRGNTHFTYKFNGMDMYCRCNCDGSHVCIAEWMYIREDVSISGTGIGTGVDGCFTCLMDGRSYRGDSKFSVTRSDITLDCDCYCNGGYYCYGETTFGYKGCRTCSLYGQSFNGDTTVPLIYNGLKVSCECKCDGSYVCYGAESELIISCYAGGSGCLVSNCGQCIVDGVRFNGFDQFGTVYRGQNLRCDCGCDGSYYCEGSGGIIISCAPGRGCVELGCSSCDIFGNKHDGGSAFDLYYKGLKLGCQCECGGNYICYGSNREIIVSCIDGEGCLTGSCRACVANNRRYNGMSTFRYDYNGIDMLCTCACDGSYYCEGVSEIIQISCVGGQCTRLGCASCNVFGLAYEGDSTFELIHSGLKLKCQCSCDSGYVCYGSSSTAIITCRGGRGYGCLESTCKACAVNNREYAGRSTFRSSYKGIDIMCTCGCDGNSYCVGITTSIEVTCIGNTCTRIGCKECNIFGREYIGGSQFDMIYRGLPVTCDCDCDGGYICRDSRSITIITCVNGFGQGCLLSRCKQCEIDGRRYDGATKFRYVYQNIDMDCTCACDSSYYCEGVREEIQISCYGGKCTTFGCSTCNIAGQSYAGASSFDIVYAGLLLNCDCGCEGSYTCRGEDTVIIRCINGLGNCIDQSCETCRIGGQTLAARSTSRVRYEDYDLNCICGCDGSVYCTGVSVKIVFTCIGGKCSPVGCTNCRVFGEDQRALSAFNIIYSGYRLDCRCDCNGGYNCVGTVNLDCRDTGSRDCLTGTCNSCFLGGREYRGNAVFKYDYNGIDVACTCGCDGSVFCQGVTEIIELRCIAGTCSPSGCRTCRIYDRDYAAFSDFDIIYGGLKLDCKCGCDSSYYCIGSSGEREIECEAGRNCLSDTCRKCIVDGRRYNAFSTFPHKYKNIDMECRCGCDGTAFCEGTEIVIYVSCIGDTCSQIGCQTCSIFGNSYQGDSNFDIVYKGVKLDCTCKCDSSYVCIGKSTDDSLTCPAQQTCVADRCKKCRVNGDRYSGGQLFEIDYQGIRLSCTCGCDGTYFCRGVSVDIEFSCFRRGGCKQIGGCRSCNIFGVEYAGRSSTDFVYQGYFVKCTCNCDSSVICRGTRNEVVIDCPAGQRDCFDTGPRCGKCRIDGRDFEGNTQFDYIYNGKDMRCTCGCDGSYYCKCKDDNSEISCNRRGSCTWIGCNTCLSDGRQRQAYEEFEKVYDNIRMNCLCSCDGSYRCQGIDRRIVIICTGESCNLQGCRTCTANGREYQNNDQFEIRQGSERKRCTCRCDGTTDCTTVVHPTCVSCLIDGVTFKGHTRDRLNRDSTQYICDCYCNGTHSCYPERRPACSECVIGGRRYDGNTQFDAELEGTRMQCTCDCNGNFVCKSDFRICTTSSGCVDNCAECVIDGQTFGANSDFQADVFGSRMQCSCDCQGGFTCRSDIRTCTPSGCVNNCRRCNIDGQSFSGNTNFDANVFGLRMQCSCDCTGNFKCISEARTCTASGCVDNCGRCNIDGQSFKGNTNFEANVFGLRMDCSCECTGSFSCRSDARTCTASGCVDNCRRCNIDGQSFKGNTNFEANVFGLRMDCSCECTGSFSCRSDTRTCTASGCVDICRQCNIDGQSFKGNTNFEANVFGLRMQCSCDCTGSFSCRSDARTCTASGCVDNCRRCNIDGQSFNGNTNFEANVFGLRMQCSCDCTGSFSCRSDTRTCTSSGCVDNCRQCLIDGRRFENSRNFQADVFGERMQCSCDCSGSYTCSSSRQTCTSVSGCIKSCQECTVNSRRHPGNSDFETILQGIRMDCSCDCSGNWACRGGTYTCTRFGCTSSCQGCEIEGRLYDGDTKFEIFHNAYGIQMTCECECSGSYTCKGTKEVESCVGSGCDRGGCNDCTINGISYRGNTQFEAIIDGLQMQCTCSCSGGYRCTGTRTEKECYGPGCTETGCSNCFIRGRTYRGNSQFEIDGDNGVRMQCMCDCDGRYSCKGEKSKTVCVGAGCDRDGTGCVSCNYEGREYRSGSTFSAVRNGVNMECTCACTGEVRCEGSRTTECEGPDCFRGCKRCVIDRVPYSGNTRFTARKGNVDYSCICYCDGSYSCKGSSGFETSCVGESCAADQCRSCTLFDKEYQLDARFRLQKNDLIMNCVCECDGAYRCFSISGTCFGDDCDVYGCKSCTAEGKVFGANSEFELSTGMICTCQCNGEYTCRAKSLQVECVGSDCGVGNGCRKCNVDGDIYPGNQRFQIRKYGLLMQCACNCDSSYTCRGYQIISEGESSVGSGCRSCEINGRRYNGNTRFQVMINGERSVCSCDCDGTYSCTDSEIECRECVINGQRYTSNSDFSLIQNGQSIRCRCDCSGNFICEGRGGGTCRGNECGTDGCNVCTIFGVRYRGNSKFTTDVDGIRMLCECLCTGEYTCKGYRQITNVILPAKEESSCKTCYVAGKEHPGNTVFKIQRGGCFQIECVCGCDGIWECPDQTPTFTCPGGGFDFGSKVVQQQRYSIAGSHVFTTGTASTDSKQSTLIYTGEESSSTVFGAGGDCRSCFINEREYNGNTGFVLQDGCLRWTCACDCSGGWNCSAVTGSQCEGPLAPFEHKQCKECEAYGGRYPPNQQFQAEDKCYRYTCTCDCDGSWECPRELTVQTCSDTSSVYDPEKGTCRQCIIGPNRYDHGDTFDLVDNCINYKCLCKCDGSYNCPPSTGARVCRTGSGSPGRIVTTGSNTVSKTGRTVVALRPSGYGTRGKYSSTGTGTGYTSSSTSSRTSSSSSGTYSGGSDGAMYKIQASGESQGGHSTGHSSGSYTSGTYSGSSGISGSERTSSRTSGSERTSSRTSSGTYSGGSDGAVYKIQASGGSQGGHSTGHSSGSYTSGSNSGSSRISGSERTSSRTSGSSTAGSFSSSSSSSSSSGQVDLTSLLAGGKQCKNCIVDGESLRGGRDFTYRSGCIEHLCDCYCNGTHFCDPEKEIDFCKLDRARAANTQPKGCTIGNRTYKTALFSYEKKCKKYYCRCYDDGSYVCDSNKTKRVC